MTLATNQLEQELGTGAARSENSNQAGYLELASADPPEVVSPVAQTDLPPEAAVARRRRVSGTRRRKHRWLRRRSSGFYLGMALGAFALAALVGAFLASLFSGTGGG